MGIVPHEGIESNDSSLPHLDPRHLVDLRASGLTDDAIRGAGLYSVRGGDRISGLLGGYLDHRTSGRMGSCLAFPYFDATGETVSYTNGSGTVRPFVRLRPDTPRKGKSSDGKPRPIKYESPLGSKSHAYLPPGTRAVLDDPSILVLITEGEKKALCSDQYGMPCIGLAGVWCFAVARTEADIRGKKIGPRELIPDLDVIAWAGRTVTIAFDSDIVTKPEVQWACWTLAELLREHGATVRVATIPGEKDGTKNGLDDYIVRHGIAKFREIVAAATPPERPEANDPRPKIVIGTDEYRVNEDAIMSLGSAPNLYQRGGSLVRMVRTDATTASSIRRPHGSPVVRDIPPPLLRERMTREARWVTIRGEKREEVPSHPPEWCVSAVHARGNWPGIRPLEAVVNHPVALPDGTILTANGYDPKSGLLVAIPADLKLTVPHSPSLKDVHAAVEIIDEAIVDFPFQRPEHRAAWYAGLLTPLAWFAFDGPAPMLLIDGNTRGVGKGLLADVIALTLTRRRFAVMNYTGDREELRKRITSLAAEGERMILLDNLAGAVGNDVLDAALTADRWKDRLLGVNKIYDGPLHVAWYATGNNVQLAADTARRCSHCRLETAEERPELRADVKHKDLRRHIREHRGPLLSAALTILRGWFAAGKPRHNLPPWGSYEPWSDLVREAVVYAGLPDPGETRIELQSGADRDAQTMTAMIDVIMRMDPHGVGKTTGEIVEAIRNPDDPLPEWHGELKSAVEELCGKLDSRMLGNRLRHFKRRNFNGKMIDEAGKAQGGVVRWTVRAAKPTARLGGSGGSGGSIPAQAASAMAEEGEI